ncbi:MarR family transcriptional regulator, partial [Acidimicrobiaceae bacterium USS-CC1]|nr:MarR family transcriptional regulator [Acidiferrimicrobium australe]
MDETRAPAADDLDTIVDTVLEASRALLAVAARCLNDVAGDVTLIQYRSLVRLCSHGPQSLATLAEAVGVSRSTESRLCERLVR